MSWNNADILRNKKLAPQISKEIILKIFDKHEWFMPFGSPSLRKLGYDNRQRKDMKGTDKNHNTQAYISNLTSSLFLRWKHMLSRYTDILPWYSTMGLEWKSIISYHISQRRSLRRKKIEHPHTIIDNCNNLQISKQEQKQRRPWGYHDSSLLCFYNFVFLS